MPVSIWVDESQFPEAVARDLAECFRTRRVNPKFLYTSYRQAEKWLKVHEAYSPARNDPDCLATYDEAFANIGRIIENREVSLIGLGCGGGQKDARLAERLNGGYTPIDVSLPLVVTASQRVQRPGQGIVCDLATATNLEAVLPQGNARLFTFFGMIPNFEPGVILPKLATLVRTGDLLLFSANLIPEAGVESVLPQYANALTEAWLRAFLEDFGVRGGSFEWGIENGNRIRADFVFASKASVQGVEFVPGDRMQIFFSYRYAAEQLREMLGHHGLETDCDWITPSGEEGVFLCRTKGERLA